MNLLKIGNTYYNADNIDMVTRVRDDFCIAFSGDTMGHWVRGEDAIQLGMWLISNCAPITGYDDAAATIADEQRIERMAPAGNGPR